MKGVQCYELFGGIALKKSHFYFIGNVGMCSCLNICFPMQYDMCIGICMHVHVHMSV